MFDKLFTEFSYTSFGSWFNGRHHTLTTLGQLVKSTVLVLILEAIGIYQDIATIRSITVSPYMKPIWLIFLILLELVIILEWIYAICRHVYYIKHYTHKNNS